MHFIRNSWSLGFVRRNLPYMSVRSVLRYRRYVLDDETNTAAAGELLCLSMRRPFKGSVWLRKRGSDLDTYREIVANGSYRPVIERLGPVEFIIDLGANIGLASRFFAAAYPHARILCVEPDQGNVEVLRMNLGSGVGERVKILRAAAWGEDRAVAVSRPPAPGQFDSITVQEVAEGTQNDVNVTAGLRLGEIILRSGFPRVDLLKIDIEGAEAQVLRGDLAWTSAVSGIAIEFHGDARQATQFDRRFSELGFRIEDLNSHTTLAVRAA